MKTMSPIWLRIRRAAANLAGDCRGIAATEFAMIVPIMLVLFFGTVEFSSGVAVDRKVTIMARTLADLTSQSLTVADTDMANFVAASAAIMTPYVPTPMQVKVSELYVDPGTLVARVQWSKSATVNSAGVATLGAGRAVSSPVVIPAALVVGGTYLIYSEVTYLYTPTVGFVMTQSGVNLSDVAYTRPRQSTCVFYSPAVACTTL